MFVCVLVCLCVCVFVYVCLYVCVCFHVHINVRICGANRKMGGRDGVGTADRESKMRADHDTGDSNLLPTRKWRRIDV